MSIKGSTEVQVVPAALPVATLREQATPIAHLVPQNQEDTPSKERGWILQTRGAGKRARKSTFLETKSRHIEQFEKQCEEVWTRGKALLKKHWDWDQNEAETRFSIDGLRATYNGGKGIGLSDFRRKIEELLVKKFPGATQIAIEFNTFSLKFLNKSGEAQHILEANLPKEIKELVEFLNFWQGAQETAMLILGFSSWHSRLGTETNRPLHSEEPFKINNAVWNRYIPKTYEEFVQNGHQDTLLAKLPEGDRREAKKRIWQAEVFIRHCQEKLREPEEIGKKLASINRYAVYWAAAFWDEKQGEKHSAQRVINALTEVFDAERNLSEKKIGFNPRNWKKKPLKDDLVTFAREVGGAFFHGELPYLDFLESFGIPPTGPSVEEFVIHNLIHTLNGQPSLDDGLPSFGLQPPSPEDQTQIRGQIQEARAAAAKTSPPPLESSFIKTFFSKL